jgi:decaprenyl-phosphate phosphoribosyltransferase
MKILSIIESTRPKQWHKNLLVLVAPIAAGVNVFVRGESILAVLMMVLASAIIYVVNDLKDKESDKQHPQKRYRPLASERMSTKEAIGLIAILTLLLVTCFPKIDLSTILVILGYLTLQINYSFWAKNVPVLELVMVSSGFLIRVLVGASVFGVIPSVYLLGATTAGSITIVVSKRLAEVIRSDNKLADKKMSRFVLTKYDRDELKAFLVLSSAVFIMFFSLWAFEDNTNVEVRYIRGLLVFPVLIGTFRILGKSLSGHLEKPEHDLFIDPISLIAGSIAACLFVISIWMI